MNRSLEHLFEVAQKQTKVVIGLMSGTSLDGLDIALCEFGGFGQETTVDLRQFETVSYSPEVKEKLQKVVSVDQASMQEVCLMNTWLGDYHADLILEALRRWKIEPVEVDCIASHGQTVYHAPAAHHGQAGFPNSTLQLGDGDHIARKTGILTVSDFRQKHTAAGGEGAPMASLVDQLLFSHDERSQLLLNIGGIANFTYLPAGDDSRQAITTDVGPGNTLIDGAMRQHAGEAYDKDGAMARRGTVQPELLKALLKDSFFSLPMPRSTGPERFNLEWVRDHQKQADCTDLDLPDLVATLTWLSAQAIADGIKEVCDEELPEIYISGGGMHNGQLVEWMEQLLETSVRSFENIGFDPDAKEAVCFAVLANELLSGEAFTISPKQHTERRVNFGKISLPV